MPLTSQEREVLERISNKMKEKGVKQKDLCAQIGVAAQAFTNWKSGNNSSFMKKLPQIAKVLDCPLDYLLRGHTKSPVCGDFVPVENVRVGMRPVLGSVSAGRGVFAEEDVIGYERVSEEYDRDDTFWLRVFGDSMSPKIDNGDLVLVDRAAVVESGNIVVAVVDDAEGYVKKVEIADNSIALISINTAYPPMIFVNQETERVYILGRVVKQERSL